MNHKLFKSYYLHVFLGILMHAQISFAETDEEVPF